MKKIKTMKVKSKKIRALKVKGKRIKTLNPRPKGKAGKYNRWKV